MEVLPNCKYPSWAIDRMECKNFQQNRLHNTRKNKYSNNQNNTYQGYIVIPYG